MVHTLWLIFITPVLLFLIFLVWGGLIALAIQIRRGYKRAKASAEAEEPTE